MSALHMLIATRPTRRTTKQMQPYWPTTAMRCTSKHGRMFPVRVFSPMPPPRSQNFPRGLTNGMIEYTTSTSVPVTGLLWARLRHSHSWSVTVEPCYYRFSQSLVVCYVRDA